MEDLTSYKFSLVVRAAGVCLLPKYARAVKADYVMPALERKVYEKEKKLRERQIKAYPLPPPPFY